jgi:hypothetical protein
LISSSYCLNLLAYYFLSSLSMDRVFDFNDLMLADPAVSPGGDLPSPAGTSVNAPFSSPLSTMYGSTGGLGTVLRMFKSGGVRERVQCAGGLSQTLGGVGFAQRLSAQRKATRGQRWILKKATCILEVRGRIKPCFSQHYGRTSSRPGWSQARSRRPGSR